MALVAIMGEFSVDAMTAHAKRDEVPLDVAASRGPDGDKAPQTYKRRSHQGNHEQLLFVALACNALGSMGGLMAPTFAVLFASRLVQAVGTRA